MSAIQEKNFEQELQGLLTKERKEKNIAGVSSVKSVHGKNMINAEKHAD